MPNITTLDVIAHFSNIELVSIILGHVASVAQNITSLGVSGSSLPTILQASSVNFNRLTTLRLHKFKPEDLHALTQCANLVELYFKYYGSSRDQYVALEHEITLPALEILSFTGDDYTPYLRVHILRDVLMPKLRTLVLRPYLEWDLDDPDAIQALQHRSPLLQKIDIGVGRGPGPNVWSLASALTSLAYLPQIREIRFDTHQSRTRLFDAHVELLVENLPLLESLTLIPRDAENSMAFTEKSLASGSSSQPIKGWRLAITTATTSFAWSHFDTSELPCQPTLLIGKKC
ncbi:hypothetical protein FRB97_004433 [Tulasnella sp. 331]|nr:hypothetical protein FRB97_004433 [Tulasnella sp. 331]